MLSKAADATPRRRRGRPPHTAAEKASQRARLLESSMAAIRRIGADASVDQLAAAAGVSKPVLYASFGGKEEIADAIGEELARRVEQQFMAHLAESGTLDLASGVKALIDTLFDLLAEEREIYGFVVRCVRVSDRRLLDNGFVRAVDERVQQMSMLIAPDTEPALLAILAHGVVGFVTFAVETWLDTRQPPREDLIEAIINLLQNGVRP